MWRGRPRSRKCRWRIRIQFSQGTYIKPVRIRDPSQPSRCDSRDAKRNSATLAEFLRAVQKQLHQRAVNIAKPEEAEVVSADGMSHTGDVAYPITVVCSGLIL